MPDNYGIGTGIGQGLSKVGQALQGYADRRYAERDKQADAFETQAKDIAANIAQMGGPNAPGAQSLVQELQRTVSMHNALFKPHETPALIARIGRVFGRQPGAPTPDVRASMTPQSMIAAAPRFRPGAQQMDLQTEIAQMTQAVGDAFPNMPLDQRKQRAFELVAGRREGGAQPRYSLVGQPVKNEAGEYIGTYVNPSDPTDIKKINLGKDFGEKTSRGGAKGFYPEYDKANKLIGIRDKATGEFYGPEDMQSEDTPAEAKTRFAQLTQMQTQEEASKLNEKMRQERVIDARSEEHARIQASHDYQLMQLAFTRQDYSSATQLVTAAEKEVSTAQSLVEAGARAEQSKNRTTDELFLNEVFKGIGARYMNRERVEQIIGKGTLSERLSDFIRQTVGDQALSPEVRERLVDYVNGLYEAKYENLSQRQQQRDSIRQQNPPAGAQKTTPSTPAPDNRPRRVYDPKTKTFKLVTPGATP